MESSFWEDSYRADGTLWGERPGILAHVAAGFVLKEKLPTAGKTLLDIGCGYGRDLIFLVREWKCKGLGVDSSPAAIALAQQLMEKAGTGDVAFQQASFQALHVATFDLIFVANLYQILPRVERMEFCALLPGLMAPGGYLFLGTHSVSDPEHFGKGKAVDSDANSFIDQTFVHMSTEDELKENFHFLHLHKLYEHEHLEPRAGGQIHHHVSWILIGSKPEGD
jgi:cyclopropane fatty-acyl-phospholipid synthase-like methyltransferase